MASILSKTGIQDNNTIRVWHITQSVDAFTGTKAYDITLSGSLTVVGDLNLNTNPTGTLIGNAAYSPTSSYSTYSVTSSIASTASISYDVLTFQMYHYETDPIASSTYYFAINPSGSTLTTTTSSVGTFLPKELRILSASVTSFVNGTLASTETSSYALFLNTNSVYNFSNTLDHSNASQYFIEKLDTDPVDFDANDLDLPLYMEWRTPTTWITPPTSVSHNIVFYCTRGYSAP
jgi:hypothetical protein